MRHQIEFGLQGAFKVDLYSGGNFVSTTDWFSNFITQTGLMYPTIYPFVDCFRFLSLGTSSIVNSGQKLGTTPTTGLGAPITGIYTTSGVQPGTYIGWQGYETGVGGQQSACGTDLVETGPRFFRAWTIPTGDINTVVNDPNGFLNIQEFMVSPSSGSDSTGCYAFSRIVRNLSIPNGYKAVISYQLKLNLINTGISFFKSGTFQTGNADVTNDPDLVASWGYLSGYYRHVYHGFECIDNVGASFTPVYGAGMEPYLSNLSSTTFYLSPDNSNFEVNGAGGPQSNVTLAYSADGLMDTVNGIPMTYDRTTDSSFDTTNYNYLNNLYYTTQSIPVDFPQTIASPFNIRIGNNNTSLNSPSLQNYSVSNGLSNYTYQQVENAVAEPISFATPGWSGFDPNRANFQQKAVFSTRVFKLPLSWTGQNLPTGRKKTITRKTLFSPVSSLGYNTRFGSLVYAWIADNTPLPNANYYPMMDALFFDTSGRSLMPHYRLISGIVLTDRGSGVANSYFSLIPSTGDNITRYVRLQSFQGECYNGTGVDPSHPTLQVFTPSNLQVGLVLSGGFNPNTAGDISFNVNGCSGWGGVYGLVVSDNFYNAQFDVGLTDHSLTVNTVPSTSGTLYWPSVINGQPIKLSITGIQYFTTDPCFSGNGSPLSSGQPGYDWVSNPCNFRPPTGYYNHHEHIGTSGWRLQPNYGIPNNSGIYTYNALTGGAYPGLSFDNGLELYFDITWSSPCGSSSVTFDCNDPV